MTAVTKRQRRIWNRVRRELIQLVRELNSEPALVGIADQITATINRADLSLTDAVGGDTNMGDMEPSL
ncbi:hypothetical protein [Nevskia sp.]|uniref:hypothetical protein n=1 Tax=Nevskia sp. TaxID=1929292 RepID=UPI0025F0ED58|nr:hypothetical protein [Nevskia sp.]